MKRVILSGGGTGGHIYPAITIAREIERLTDAEILFVGTPNGMEASLIPGEGYDFAALPSAGLKRKLTPENIKVLLKAAGGLWKARRILSRFKPDVVIGTGGYVCGPILMAAALSHIPTMIQEQNVIPGVTNKILSRVVPDFPIRRNAYIREIRCAGKSCFPSGLSPEKSSGFLTALSWC